MFGLLKAPSSLDGEGEAGGGGGQRQEDVGINDRQMSERVQRKDRVVLREWQTEDGC